MDTPSTDIGPGIGAFVTFFLLAVLLWFLMRNMNARMRRMAYAERDRVARVHAKVLAAEAEAHAKEAAERGEDPTVGPRGGSASAKDTSPPSAGPAPQEPGPPSA